MSYNTKANGSSGGAKILTTMKDFIILTKIGKSTTTTLINLTIFPRFSGDGAYSEVYKVKRNNDSQIYALKKVSPKKPIANAINNGSF